jgi:hypothetical protein
MPENFLGLLEGNEEGATPHRRGGICGDVLQMRGSSLAALSNALRLIKHHQPPPTSCSENRSEATPSTCVRAGRRGLSRSLLSSREFSARHIDLLSCYSIYTDPV